MNRTGKTLFVFGLYAILTGAVFIAYPPIIKILHLPTISSGWLRLIGLLVIALGSYYVVAGKTNDFVFARASVIIRFGFFIGVVILVITGEMPGSLLTFGILDAMGALWTRSTLKR